MAIEGKERSSLRLHLKNQFPPPELPVLDQAIKMGCFGSAQTIWEFADGFYYGPDIIRQKGPNNLSSEEKPPAQILALLGEVRNGKTQISMELLRYLIYLEGIEHRIDYGKLPNLEKTQQAFAYLEWADMQKKTMDSGLINPGKEVVSQNMADYDRSNMIGQLAIRRPIQAGVRYILFETPGRGKRGQETLFNLGHHRGDWFEGLNYEVSGLEVFADQAVIKQGEELRELFDGLPPYLRIHFLRMCGLDVVDSEVEGSTIAGGVTQAITNYKLAHHLDLWNYLTQHFPKLRSKIKSIDDFDDPNIQAWFISQYVGPKIFTEEWQIPPDRAMFLQNRSVPLKRLRHDQNLLDQHNPLRREDVRMFLPHNPNAHPGWKNPADDPNRDENLWRLARLIAEKSVGNTNPDARQALAAAMPYLFPDDKK